MEKITKYILTAYIILVIASALLLPPIKIISLDNFLLPFAIIAVTLNFSKNKVFWISGLLIGLIICLELTSNYLNDGITINESFWTFRWIKLFTIGWATYYIFRENRKIFESIMLFGFIGMTLINALQLLGVESIIQLYEPYTEQADLIANSLVNGRLSGTFINPNNNGLVMALFGIYFLVSEWNSKYILLAMSGAMILMTQSRTVFLSYILVVVLSMLYVLFKKNRRQFFYFIGASIVFIIILAQINLRNLSSIFDGSAFHSNSVTIRYKVIEKTIEANKSNVWFGHGKLENIPDFLGYSIDNEFAYIYLEYGLLGLLLFLLIVSFLCRISIGRGRFYIACIGLVMLMIICGITNLSFTNLEIGPLFAVIFSATYGLSALNKHKIISEHKSANQNQ